MIASLKGVLYVGMTRNIQNRIDQHRTGAVPGFSKKYRTEKLVWCEATESFEAAREREAQIKRWRRSKKVDLIERDNPCWQDISKLVG